MEEFIQLVKDFEARNNISIVVQIYSDGSSVVEEFWSEEHLYEGEAIDDLMTFIRDTEYKLDKNDGRCLSPAEKLDITNIKQKK
jgi:hypothetical protein